jgi:DNA-binding Lrp family transcriptional regulator
MRAFNLGIGYAESLDSGLLPINFRLSPKAMTIMILLEMVGCVSAENFRQVVSLHDQMNRENGTSLIRRLEAAGLIKKAGADVYCNALYGASSYTPELINALTLALSYTSNIDEVRNIRRGEVGSNIRFTVNDTRYEIIPVNLNTLGNITRTLNEDAASIERLKAYMTNVDIEALLSHKVILIPNDETLKLMEKKIKELGLKIPFTVAIPNKDSLDEQIGYSFLELK